MRYNHERDTEYDLAAMIARPLYFGMMFNIIIPAALMFGCFYLSNNSYMANHIPGIANGLFYVFISIPGNFMKCRRASLIMEKPVSVQIILLYRTAVKRRLQSLIFCVPC